MKLKSITLERHQRKVLAFQFLTVAVRFAEVGTVTSNARLCEKCMLEMREAYDSALLLSGRASFTLEDCRAFDSGGSYIESSFHALAVRIRGLRARASDRDIDDSSVKEWEPMWSNSESTEFRSDAPFPGRIVRHHLERIQAPQSLPCVTHT